MDASRPSILLRAAPSPTSIPADHVFFAFETGRLTYDCATCGAQCCRGHGYNLRVGDELQRHLASRPAVKFFLNQHEVEADLYHAIFSLREVTGCRRAAFGSSELRFTLEGTIHNHGRSSRVTPPK